MRTAWCAVTVAWEAAKRGPEVWSGRSLPRVRPVSDRWRCQPGDVEHRQSRGAEPMRAAHELHEGIGRTC